MQKYNITVFFVKTFSFYEKYSYFNDNKTLFNIKYNKHKEKIMNKLKTIGLTAFGTTLIASSAFAAEMSVSGGASLTLDSTDQNGNRGNGFYMGDSINFNASGEMDNGFSVAVHYEIDGGALDDHSFSLGLNDAGTLTFAGSGGSTSMSAMDDKTPNAYEESWDIVAGTPTVINGVSGANSFLYTSPTVQGATVTVAYINASAAVTAASYMDFGITLSPEMVEGLTVGFATGDSEEAIGTKISESTMYANYAWGPVTVGYQMSDYDHPTAGSDLESTAMGISYAVSDNISVAYNEHTVEKSGDTDDQEASGISVSFTMGSMSLSGAMNELDNAIHDDAADYEGYEFTLAFAF